MHQRVNASAVLRRYGITPAGLAHAIGLHERYYRNRLRHFRLMEADRDTDQGCPSPNLMNVLTSPHYRLWVGECPFCEGDDAIDALGEQTLIVDPITGSWDCVICGTRGDNPYHLELMLQTAGLIFTRRHHPHFQHIIAANEIMLAEDQAA
jgi:hypothetical protein